MVGARTAKHCAYLYAADPVKVRLLARLIIARFTDAHRLATGPLRRRDELAMNALEVCHLRRLR